MANYEIASDVEDIARKILRARADEGNKMFEHINLERVRFARKMCKQGQTKRVFAEVSGVSAKMKLLTDYKYLMIVHSGNFDELSDEHKEQIIEHELLHISTDFDGGTFDHDVQDFRYMLNKYGPNYMLDMLYPKVDGKLETK